MTDHVPVFSCVTFWGLNLCGLSTLLLFFNLGILNPVCVNVLAFETVLQEHFDRQIKGTRFSSAESRTRVIPIGWWLNIPAQTFGSTKNILFLCFSELLDSWKENPFRFLQKKKAV